MNQRLTKDLPKFMMFNEFFAGLGEDFRSVKLSQPEKQGYVDALKTLGGSPAHLFRQLRDDLDISAQVREVRSYGEGRVFVRFDFCRMTESGRWGAPIQLMVLFDELKNIVAYTVLRGRGDMEDGVRFLMTKKRYDWNEYDTTEDVSSALSFLRLEPTGEVGVEDKANSNAFMYIYAGMGNTGTRYDIEWYLACEPWLLTVKSVDVGCVRRVLSALDKGGVKALDDAAEWMQFDFLRNYKDDGVEFNIDLELHRFLERAKKSGDVMVEESIRAVGINETQEGESRKVRVAYGRSSRMLDRLSGYADPEDEDACQEDQARIACYLAVRNHMWSIHNFGWRFHFGRGVPVDYDKAVFWQEKSAAMGDHYSMQNLGVIYSEKNSPVHDCGKAFEWFEKAIAMGDTYAMGQLAHCLLCGENGKDVDRAVALSKRAMEANPDKADFRETYERALRLSCGEEE